MVRKMDFVDECYADKDLSLLEKLTLVIPTYNRNFYLSRCLWYHAHFPFGEIIVADSSPENKKVVNRFTVEKIRSIFNANIRYLEYEPETEKYGGDIYRKWGDAVLQVRTEYSHIVTDKEFINPSVQNTCIKYMEHNPFIQYADSAHINVSYDETRCEFVYMLSKSFVSTEALSILRLDEMAHNPGFTLLSLHRSKMHKHIFSKLTSSGINDIRYGEKYLELADCIQGRAYFLEDNIMTVRDIISFYGKNDSVRKKESSCYRYFYNDCYGRKDFNEEQIDKCVISLHKMCCDVDGCDYNLLDVEKLIRYYLKKKGAYSAKSLILNRFGCIKSLFYVTPIKYRGFLKKIFLRNDNTSANLKKTDCLYHQIQNSVIHRILESFKEDEDEPII